MKDLSILQPDTRVIFGKYSEDHTVLLNEAVLNNLPTTLDQIPQAIEAIFAEMAKNKIAMYVDSYFTTFDLIWDNLPNTLKETTNEQPSNDPSPESNG